MIGLRPLTSLRGRLLDEAGAVLPLVALSMVVLFVFAAFAVDLGHAWAQERLNQTAADGGVTFTHAHIMGSTCPAVCMPSLPVNIRRFRFPAQQAALAL